MGTRGILEGVWGLGGIDFDILVGLMFWVNRGTMRGREFSNSAMPVAPQTLQNSRLGSLNNVVQGLKGWIIGCRPETPAKYE